MKGPTIEQIKEWLDVVKDPEIPVLSLNDLGVITGIELSENGHVQVNMTPTFAGCPAMDVMKSDVEEVLQEKGIQDFDVHLSFDTQWNSNMISERGREALKKFGLAPPPKHNLQVDIDLIEHAKCPYCDSENTIMHTPFGPALCRSMHYCNDCKQAFEQFKPL
jgi:ring-1,2-phenylacetyl-CoA epoxidase subunit PaaD